MKTVSIFVKVLTVFLLYPMLFYFGKLKIKFYIHIVYWILMTPALLLLYSQYKYGNTINKTRTVCALLTLRILLSNFDFEGKMLLQEYYVRVIGLTINFSVTCILTMFLTMFDDKFIVSLTTSVAVSTLSSLAWQGGSYDNKSFVNKEDEAQH